ncbi:hypothetical protein SUDANB120_00958 [Streptomyces sp. enrichment culture]|nr:hypothetical protein GCM10010286_51250 [Streptomyces toxytricini]
MPAIGRLQRPCSDVGGVRQAVVKMYHADRRATVASITGIPVIRL